MSPATLNPAKSVVACVVLVSVLLLMAVQCSQASPASPGLPHRDMISSAKVRQTRGFRNSALSTARGFGKRTSPNGIAPILSSVLSDGNSAISTEWLANLMSKNPDVAQLIVDRFVDTDGEHHLAREPQFTRHWFKCSKNVHGDGVLTVDELVREI